MLFKATGDSMDRFKIKCMMAKTYDFFGINSFRIKLLNKKYQNDYIRVINYHHSPAEDSKQFVKQIGWFAENFEICGLDKLREFLNGETHFSGKPGLIITFDDGYLDNYQVAHKYLSSNKIPAVYMVSAGLVGRTTTRDGIEASYISAEDLKKMIEEGASIGCHTFSHHRMCIDDSEEVLRHEIVEAKNELEQMIGIPVTVFCWCGGEEETYTKSASDLIRSSGYEYGFMTNSAPIVNDCDTFQLDRSNIEASWPLSLVRFQLSGVIDKRLKEKRRRVHELTKQKPKD